MQTLWQKIQLQKGNEETRCRGPSERLNKYNAIPSIIAGDFHFLAATILGNASYAISFYLGVVQQK
jgi:hypothetical protein